MGDTFPSNVNYTFAGKTSTTSLRPHLAARHRELYMELKEKHGWSTNLPGEASQATTAVTQDGQIDAFNEQTFHLYLLNFIVANDQVSAFCFRLLMMLIFALLPSR
jgi:hypothetical protein